jgi:putative membrane protein
MKHSVLIAVSMAALALSGCKKSADPAADVAATSAAASDAAVPAAEATANPDQAFADAAAASDAFEIQSSQLAATKGQASEIKRFAAAMIKAHTDSTAKLKAAAASTSPAITPQPQLTAMQQQQLDAMSAMSGSDFEAAYKKAQVEGHQMTLDKLKAYAASGGQPSLKTFATGLVPVVTAHLNMAKAL